MRARLLAVALAGLVPALAGCKAKGGEAPGEDAGVSPGIELPAQLDPAPAPADLCPVRAECQEGLAALVARCDEGGSEDQPGRTCFEAGFVTHVVAGSAYQGDVAALTEELLRLYDLSCARGYGHGCAWAASLRLFRAGEGDRERALADAEQGCRAGSGSGCVLQAQAMLHDEATHQRGEDTLRFLCAQRELAQACGDLAHLHLAGELLPQSVNDALSFAERGCALEGPAACAAFASIVYSFESLADLSAQALDAAAFACERGVAGSCASAAVLFDRARDKLGADASWDDARVVDLLDRGCQELESPAACVLLGMLYEGGLGETLPVDFQRATELHRWACEHGDDEGCLRLGVVLSNSKDSKQAEFGRRLVVELCADGYPPACAMLPPELRGR
ncbi:sel1 repeat family protein [Pseudenhygromyxa sp. WMMC2535]|uniref:tetratricopeptide repeat protein n=1 Tax=Pseudenhygromyxa sp. WMMC2535 TaxID=2712867 RepID=UPI0015546DB1|nr:tetratricopeptide repeat protein [Pseudenhygromyxa sp. WMMC2535]NVB37425.1 sel1 repeat family protein [Pseudenhygromyxa sp. WMMC2535]